MIPTEILLGVPWDILVNNTVPPADWSWTLLMQSFAQLGIQTKKTIFIGLVIGRNDLTARV